MKKLFIIAIIITLSLSSVASAAEYTRVIGKVISVNKKDSTVKVDVLSKVCNGIHTFSIENDEALKNLEVGSQIGLYLVKDCTQAIVIGDSQ